MSELRYRSFALVAAMAAGLAIMSPGAVLAQSADGSADTADDGTDPTKLSRKLSVSLEHLDISAAGYNNTLLLKYDQPISADGATSINVTLRAVAPSALGGWQYGLGDGSVKLSRVLERNRRFGMVLSGEMIFDSADSPFRGSGQTVGKLQFTYAKFLEGGSIFAPTVAQSQGLDGPAGADLTTTTLVDLYYVPRLADKRYFMTLDPSAQYDWDKEIAYGGLAVTLGRKLKGGPGGNPQLFIKPAIFFGGDRPTDWGLEVGYKLLNF